MEKKGTLEINSISLEALERDFVEMEIPKYRAAQVFRWIHKYAAASFSDLKNISGTLQTAPAAHFYISELTPMAERTSADGTVKYLFGLFDGQTVETVLIPEEDRVTVCVSTQVGCAMGCSFCATGHAGFVRNLSSGEIAKQVEYINKSSQVTNIVFMGMGEPLLNYGAVIGAIRLLNCEAGIGLGLRRFTISTCGIVPRIYQSADEQGQVGLAVSLHAADDQKRRQIMPIAEKYPLEELMAACRYHVRKTRRRITFEYILIADFNDGLDDAAVLARLLAGLNCHVNLIPVNPVGGTCQRPDSKVVQCFARYLSQHSIPTTIRRERGLDIEAACGQLKQAAREVAHENTRSD